MTTKPIEIAENIKTNTEVDIFPDNTTESEEYLKNVSKDVSSRKCQSHYVFKHANCKPLFAKVYSNILAPQSLSQNLCLGDEELRAQCASVTYVTY